MIFMTHEEILNCSADKLEKMTDEQLLEWYKPYLNITRPELADKPVKSSPRSVNTNTYKRSKVNGILQNLGLDLRV